MPPSQDAGRRPNALQHDDKAASSTKSVNFATRIAVSATASGNEETDSPLSAKTRLAEDAAAEEEDRSSAATPGTRARRLQQRAGMGAAKRNKLDDLFGRTVDVTAARLESASRVLHPPFVTRVACGLDAWILLCADGSVVAMDREPRLLEGFRAPVTEIRAGDHHFAALCKTEVFNLYTWGSDRSKGRLGRACAGEADAKRPGAVTGIGGPVDEVSCGADFTVCITRAGNAWGFGNNANGQLGVQQPPPPSSTGRCGPVEDWFDVPTRLAWLSSGCEETGPIKLVSGGSQTVALRSNINGDLRMQEIRSFLVGDEREHEDESTLRVAAAAEAGGRRASCENLDEEEKEEDTSAVPGLMAEILRRRNFEEHLVKTLKEARSELQRACSAYDASAAEARAAARRVDEIALRVSRAFQLKPDFLWRASYSDFCATGKLAARKSNGDRNSDDDDESDEVPEEVEMHRMLLRGPAAVALDNQDVVEATYAQREIDLRRREKSEAKRASAAELSQACRVALRLSLETAQSLDSAETIATKLVLAERDLAESRLLTLLFERLGLRSKEHLESRRFQEILARTENSTPSSAEQQPASVAQPSAVVYLRAFNNLSSGAGRLVSGRQLRPGEELSVLARLRLEHASLSLKEVHLNGVWVNSETALRLVCRDLSGRELYSETASCVSRFGASLRREHLVGKAPTRSELEDERRLLETSCADAASFAALVSDTTTVLRLAWPLPIEGTKRDERAQVWIGVVVEEPGAVFCFGEEDLESRRREEEEAEAGETWSGREARTRGSVILKAVDLRFETKDDDGARLIESIREQIESIRGGGDV